MSQPTIDSPRELATISAQKTPPPNPFQPSPIVQTRTIAEISEHEGPFIAFPLTPTNFLELRLTSKVSKRDLERLKKLIDLYADSLVEDEE